MLGPLSPRSSAAGTYAKEDGHGAALKHRLSPAPPDPALALAFLLLCLERTLFADGRRQFPSASHHQPLQPSPACAFCRTAPSTAPLCHWSTPQERQRIFSALPRASHTALWDPFRSQASHVHEGRDRQQLLGLAPRAAARLQRKTQVPVAQKANAQLELRRPRVASDKEKGLFQHSKSKSTRTLGQYLMKIIPWQIGMQQKWSHSRRFFP